jgi:hypothetical protein
MRWKKKDPHRWKVKFAWYPVLIDGYWYWLNRLERRFVKQSGGPAGFHNEYKWRVRELPTDHNVKWAPWD